MFDSGEKTGEMNEEVGFCIVADKGLEIAVELNRSSRFGGLKGYISFFISEAIKSSTSIVV